MYLYQITNLINNKVYIGQTNNITKRWSNHKCCNSPDMVIAKAIKKYGIENFKFEVLYRNVQIEEIDELFYVFLSKISMNNSITNVCTFLIYRSIINKLVQFLEMLCLTQVIPKEGLMDYIQKIFEY